MFADEIEELAALGLVGTTNTDGELVRVERTVGGIEGGVWGVSMATWRVTTPAAPIGILDILRVV
jgi:hypothetical protein